MRRVATIFLFSALSVVMSAQQFPLLDGYGLDAYRLSPSYAGVSNSNIILMDARSDWSGIPGGPKTYQLSYHGRFFEKVGLGGRFTYDKTDIFKQIMVVANYSYEVAFSGEHLLNFSLSTGLFSNSIDLGAYYNDPDFVLDPVLLNSTINSKIKFVTEVSSLYRYNEIEAGIYFSNLMLGSASYEDIDLNFNPRMSYMLHAAYNYTVDDNWSVKPYLIYRGGKDNPGIVEFFGSVSYSKLWGNILYRSSGVIGIGFGGEVYDGILLNYSYNLSHNVALNSFGGHQVSLGFKLDSFLAKPSQSE